MCKENAVKEKQALIEEAKKTIGLFATVVINNINKDICVLLKYVIIKSMETSNFAIILSIC